MVTGIDERRGPRLLAPVLLALSFAIVAAIVAAPLGVRAAESAEEAAKIEAAKKEGKVVWYVSPFDVDTAEQVGKAFEAKYSGITVDVVRITAGMMYQRVMQEIQAGVIADDVFSSAEEGHHLGLKEKRLIRSYLPVDADKVVPDYQHIDPDNAYQVTCVGRVVMMRNTQKVPVGEAPKSWKDLLDPRWKDKVAFGHPAFSGYVATWAVVMTQLYGWDYFENMAGQNPLIGRAVDDAITEVAVGERLVAVVRDATTLKSKNRGNPIDLIYPEDGSIFIAAPSAILSGAPHPHAAELLMDFFMSPEYSRVLVRNGFAPLRPEVGPPEGLRPLAEGRLIRPTPAELKREIPTVIEKFRATFGV